MLSIVSYLETEKDAVEETDNEVDCQQNFVCALVDDVRRDWLVFNRVGHYFGGLVVLVREDPLGFVEADVLCRCCEALHD